MLALRVEGDQLSRQLACGMAGTGLDELPRSPTELRERRVTPVRADVARHLAHLVVRHVQPVLPAEREQQVVARDAADGLGLEAEQLADAVVLVHDVVTRAEIGERPQRPRHAGLARRPPAQHLRLRHEGDGEVAPDESSAGGRSGEEERPVSRQWLPRLQQLRIRAPQQALRAQGVATMGERDNHAKARPHERVELPLGLGHASGRERRALRLERQLLAAGERVELRPTDVEIDAELVTPDLEHPGGPPDEVCLPGERADLARVVLSAVGEIGPALARREDDRALELAQRALRERRERPDALDDVAEELDADRLAPRRPEDVENAAANGDLATLLHALDALVAGEDERLRELLEPARLADGDLDRHRPLALGRQALGRRGGRDAHETAVLDDGERPQSLPDEVRRRT